MKPIQVVLRLPPDEHERTVRHRVATGVPTNQLIRRILKRHLDEFEGQQAKRRRNPAQPA